ncbi:hypothetical protein M0R04_08785 [Candidatus Dojkabacteria bacterium]|jgi:hypothetical protein|nr:hypothetical protein [Candidatus Dojkabacteria bacterium]
MKSNKIKENLEEEGLKDNMDKKDQQAVMTLVMRLELELRGKILDIENRLKQLEKKQ